MKLIAIQSDQISSTPQENLKHLDELTADLPATDLIVLPEMFSTGFITEPEGAAEEENGPALKWMKATAAERGCAVAGSIAVRQDGKYYNRFYFVKPDGNIIAGDKHHLFTFGGEDRHFTAGSQRVIVEYCGVRFLLLVCYDLRFPVWSRNKNDYDAIIYVASWPEPRTYVWKTLLRARAIENQCWVIGTNRVGDDAAGHYIGGTAIIDHLGHTAAECRDDAEEFITADIDLAGIKAFRDKFPAWRDSDDFILR